MFANLNRRAVLAAGALLASVAITPTTPLSAFAEDGTAAIEKHQSTLATAQVEGGAIRYMDLGPKDGPALMLLHGIPTSSYLFREVAPMLAERGYRVIAPDALGAGASDKPTDAGTYETERQAARMFEVADAAGLETFVPVLHDVGGLMGWAMVQAKPERLSGLIATNTMLGLKGVTPAPIVMPIMGGKATPDQVFGQLDEKAFATSATRQWLDQGWIGGPAPDALVEAYAGDLNEGGATPYAQFFGLAVPQFMQGEAARREALASFDKPTAIIFGEQDRFFDADVVVPDLQAALGTKDAFVTRIPDAGHFLQEHAPQAYVDAIDIFMKSLGKE